MSSIENLKKQYHELLDADKFQEAIPILKQVLEMDSNDAESWYFLALTYMELELNSDAEAAMRNAFELDSENTDYLLQLGYLAHMDGRVSEAEELFNKLLVLDPMDSDAMLMLGLIAKDKEQYQDAIDLLEASYTNDEDTDTLINIIECYLDLGDLNTAEEKLELLNKADLEGEQFEIERELLARFYLDKAMSSWTGTSQDDNGETLYFPETMDQVNDAEHFLECAEIRKPKDEFYINRIQQLKDVVAVNKQDLQNNSESESADNNQNENYTEEDQLAWQKLDEIYYLWSDIEEEDGTEYHWPNTIDEVKESKRLLKEVKKIKFTSKEVKDRMKAMKEILDSAKDWIPNYTKKFLISLIISILAIVAVFVAMNLNEFKQPKFNFDSTDWVVSEKTEMVYDAFVGDYGGELKHYKTLNPGTKLTPIARMGTFWVQVETQGGQKGFVRYRKIKSGNKAVAKTKTPFYSNFENKTLLDSLDKGEQIYILSYIKTGKELTPSIAKARNSKGTIGYVPYYRLNFPAIDILPEINQTTTFPTSIANIETKVVGNTIKNLEEKFGPASSIITSNGEKISYFRQINVVKNKKKFRGLFFTLNNQNEVISYELNKEIKYKMLERLPLAKTMRDLEVFTFLGFSFYDQEDIEISWWEKFRHINWFTKIIGFIVMFIIGITGIFLFFSLPRLIINPLMLIVSHWKVLGNGLVILINFLLYGFATYIFFVWMALLMNQIFTPIICAAPTFYLWWKWHQNNINYNRCPNCHTMNVGIDKGSTFRGKTKHVSHGTHDVYKGTTETSTQIIRNYERRSTKTTEVIKHYTDHRQCIQCGYEWGVAREESEGSTTQYL